MTMGACSGQNYVKLFLSIAETIKMFFQLIVWCVINNFMYQERMYVPYELLFRTQCHLKRPRIIHEVYELIIPVQEFRNKSHIPLRAVEKSHNPLRTLVPRGAFNMVADS